MPKLIGNLDLERCPHCGINRPYFSKGGNDFQTNNTENSNLRFWCTYKCSACGGAVLAYSHKSGGDAVKIYPTRDSISSSIPNKAREFLRQSMDSLHAPSGAIVLAASSIDGMLKEKGYKEGKLFKRINEAVKNHLITNEMGKWAHAVRLESNIERHSDDNYEMPSEKDAQNVIDFAKALGQFLFVLPAKINEGLRVVNEPVDETVIKKRK